MSTARPRFSIAVHLYLWTFMALLGLLPLGIFLAAADHYQTPVPLRWWSESFAWLVLVTILFWYANWRCSSEKLRFHDGLLFVTRSMATGWMVQSFIVVPCALLVAFFGSVLIAGFGDIRRSRTYAPTTWARFVNFFYQNRMRR
jgi:hypothetical protein